ncbi:32949_t:CDS:1, partial [Racocetra persica]
VIALSSEDLIEARLNLADFTRSDLTDSIAAKTNKERASDSVKARSDLTDPSSDSIYSNNVRANNNTAVRASKLNKEKVNKTVDYSKKERVDMIVNYSKEKADETVTLAKKWQIKQLTLAKKGQMKQLTLVKKG